MPRISGIDIPDHKKIVFALRAIYGIGPKRARDIVVQTKIDPDKRAKDLTGEEISKIQRVLDQYVVEGDLRRIVNDNISRLKRIKTYRGLRHNQGLPVRGQRTRTNARVKRGSRRTVGALSKEAAAKLEATKTKKA